MHVDPNRWQRRLHQLLVIAGLLGLVLWLILRLKVITAPLIVGAGIAWALRPVVLWLRRHRVPDFVALTVPLVALTSFFVVVVAVVLPAAMAELLRASQKLPPRVTATVLNLDPWFLEIVGVKLSALVAPDVLRTNMQGVMREIVGSASSLVTWVLSSAKDVLIAIGNVLLVFVIAAFMLDDYENIGDYLTKLVPIRHRDRAAGLLERIDDTLRSFLRAELLLWVLATAVFTSSLLILQVPLAAMLGPFVAAIYLVPYIGIVVGGLLVLGVALVEAPTLMTIAGVAVTFAGFYAVDALFITPKVIGARVGLRPLVVLLGIVGAAELFGVIGVLLAIPSLAVGRIVLLEFLDGYRTSRAYTRTVDPPPPQPDAEPSGRAASESQ
jgi:predicted PurR-regulated permease PerM